MRSAWTCGFLRTAGIPRSCIHFSASALAASLLTVGQNQAYTEAVAASQFSQNLSFQLALDPAVPTSTLSIDHNLIDGYRAGEGEIYGDAPVVGKARLVDITAADFHLQSTSPAIDHGSPVGASLDDFDGAYRPQEGDHDGIAAFDIGAYEFGAWRVYLPIMVREN